MRYSGKSWCVTAVAALLGLVSCSRTEPAKPLAKSEYVAAGACAECHADLARGYSTSGMARAFHMPDAASFPNPEAYFHQASSTWYQIAARDGAWYERWWQSGPGGKPGNAGEQKIDYVMGSGNHVRTFLHRNARGALTELPLAWYAEKGGYWALNPGFDMSDPPVGRKIGYDCMFCHNAYPAIPAGHEDSGAEPLYTGELPQGIDCQRCHGPGGNHIRAVKRSGATVGEIRNAIVNPSKLSKNRAMEVCEQCHLATTSAPLPNVIRRYDRGPFSYRPGEALSAFQLAFDHAPGSGREGKFEIVSSAYRLRQSKCFIESKGELGCTTCHNPHDARHGQAGLDSYNKACARCHAPEKLNGSAHPADRNCVGCHMPKRRAEDVVHAVMTDHRIQRRPAANLLAEFPEKHGPGMEYRGEVAPYGDRDDLYTAVAQVSQRSNSEAGIPRLQAELARRKPERVEFYMELGNALQRAGRAEESVAAYRTALEKKPGSALLLSRLAQPLRALGKTQEPLEAMLKSLQADPDQPEAWNNLGLLQSELGDQQAAITSFRKAIALDSEFAESHNGLGAALAQAGQVPEAEAEYHAALQLRPALPGAHANLAYLLANRGDFAESIRHFEQAGDGAAVQLSYGITLARMNRLAEARAHLEKSLRADAGQPMAHEVLGGLLEAAGRVPEAAAAYREAIRLRPDFGKAHFDLGALLARKGDKAGAAAELRIAQADADPRLRQAATAGLAALGIR